MSTKGLLKRTENFSNLLENVPEAYRRSLRMNEYLLVLNPHEELRNKIMKVKAEFADKYEASMAKFLKPHVTLVNFMTWDMMEEKIIQRLHHIAMGATPFKVELKDYGCFPTHSIYINVTTKVPIVNLVKEMKSVQRLMKADPKFDPTLHYRAPSHHCPKIIALAVRKRLARILTPAFYWPFYCRQYAATKTFCRSKSVPDSRAHGIPKFACCYHAAVTVLENNFM